MIEIKTNNLVYQHNLQHLLKTDFPTETTEAILIHLPQKSVDTFFQTPPDVPTLVLNATHPDASAELTCPISATQLKSTLRRLIEKHKNTPVFETSFVQFTGPSRQLILKPTQTTIRLTEKEAALLIYLYQHAPRLVSKEELLQEVWSYHPQTETHTVESHIYGLRQKIGPESNALVQSSAEGYTLILA